MQDSYRSKIFIFTIMDNSHTIVILEKKGGGVEKRRGKKEIPGDKTGGEKGPSDWGCGVWG